MQGRMPLGGAAWIKTNLIHGDPNQPRKHFDETYQQEVTDSVDAIGFINPLSVRFVPQTNSYILISGEHRLRAARRLNLEEVPCWIRENGDDEVLVHQIAENWIRRELQPWEIADALKRLEDTYHYNQTKLAKVTGKPQGEISKFMSLHKLDPKAQKAARADTSGALTKSHLYAASRLSDPLEQQALIRDITENKLKVTEVEKKVGERRKEKETGAKKAGAPTVKKRYVLNRATVEITFRKKNVSAQDEIDTLQGVLQTIKHRIRSQK